MGEVLDIALRKGADDRAVQHPAHDAGGVLDWFAASELDVVGAQEEDVAAEFARLLARGVRFTMEPTDMGPVTIAVLDDTCGNLIQLVQRRA